MVDRTLTPGTTPTVSSNEQFCATQRSDMMPCIRKAGHEGSHLAYPLKGPADRAPVNWESKR